MKTIFCTLIITIMTTSAFASNYTGKIDSVFTGIYPPYAGKVFISVTGSVTDIAPCQTNTAYDYVFDSSTQDGVNTLTMLLSAIAQDKLYI